MVQARGRIRSYRECEHSLSPKSSSEEQGTVRTNSSTTQSSNSNSSMNSIGIDSNFTSPQKESEDSSSVPVTSINKISYVHGAYAGAAPLFMNDKKWMMILEHLMPEQHLILSNYTKQTYGVIDPLKVMKWAENNPVVAAYGMLHSEKSLVVDEGEITPPPVTKKRRDFMRELAHTKISVLSTKIADKQRKKKMQSQRNVNPALEWDVFLDPTIVMQVDSAIRKMEALMDNRDHETFDEELVAANIEVDRQVSRLMNRMMLAHGSAAQLLVEAVGVAAKYNFSRVVKTTKQLHKKVKQKSRRNIFGFSTTDTTVDEDLESPIPSGKNVGATSKAADVKTSAIFVNRWLRIFAFALKLGKQSIDSIEFQVRKGGVRKDNMKKSRSVEGLTSRFLRGTLNSMSFDNDNDESAGLDVIPVDEDWPANPPLCGLFLCLGMNDPASEDADHDVSTLAESAELIKNLLGDRLRLVLDMKSRRVPAKVWGRLIDNLRSRGLIIDGIGSFDIDELRQIKSSTSTPVTSISFFHSAGDLQRACHANEVRELFSFLYKYQMYG